MERKFVTMPTQAFLASVDAHLADHVEAGKSAHESRQQGLARAGVLVKRKPAVMIAKKRKP